MFAPWLIGMKQYGQCKKNEAFATLLPCRILDGKGGGEKSSLECPSTPRTLSLDADLFNNRKRHGWNRLKGGYQAMAGVFRPGNPDRANPQFVLRRI